MPQHSKIWLMDHKSFGDSIRLLTSCLLARCPTTKYKFTKYLSIPWRCCSSSRRWASSVDNKNNDCAKYLFETQEIVFSFLLNNKVTTSPLPTNTIFDISWPQKIVSLALKNHCMRFGGLVVLVGNVSTHGTEPSALGYNPIRKYSTYSEYIIYSEMNKRSHTTWKIKSECFYSEKSSYFMLKCVYSIAYKAA